LAFLWGKRLESLGYYIHLKWIQLAGGLYCPEANDLKKCARKLLFHEDLEVILNEKEFKKMTLIEMKNTLKIPRGYEKRTSRYLLKLKALSPLRKLIFHQLAQKISLLRYVN
jgi:hypothetical protein